MSVEDIRNRQRTSPEWLAVEIINRIETLEAKVAELTKPAKRGRPKKGKDDGMQEKR